MATVPKSAYPCPCCGFKGLMYPAYEKLASPSAAQGLKPPYARHFGNPSYEVCSCCGFEFGNDDEPGTAPPVSFGEYLNDWIEKGTNWFDASFRPDGWDLEKQLSAAGIKTLVNPTSQPKHGEDQRAKE